MPKYGTVSQVLLQLVVSTHLGLFMCVNYSHEHSMGDHFASQVIDTLDHSYPVILLIILLPFLASSV